MGNYYPPMEEYDPIKISKNLAKTEMISSSGTAVKYPDEEVNYILFCHALNNPEEALNTEEVQDEEENINHGPRKVILYNPIEEEEFEESSMNVKENSSSHNKITITESNPSFAVKMLKNFQDPSSLTISENQSKSDASMGIPQPTKLSEHLKAFF